MLLTTVSECRAAESTPVDLISPRLESGLADLALLAGLSLHPRAELGEHSRAVVVAYDEETREQAEMLAFRVFSRTGGRVVLLALHDGVELEDGHACASAHLRIGLDDPRCGRLVRLLFRTRLPIRPAVRVGLSLLSSGPTEVWDVAEPTLEGVPDGSSVKRVALAARSSRWTVRRRLRKATGLNPGELMIRVRGVLALGLLAEQPMTLVDVARSLGSTDSRSVRRALMQAADGAGYIAGKRSRGELKRLFASSLLSLEMLLRALDLPIQRPQLVPRDYGGSKRAV